MRTMRRSGERGRANHGWLDSRHTFSFADYYDPAHMGFGPLRVINEDRVAPGKGFATHGHRSMEILSYVISGALEHKDSMGNGSVIRPGEIQYMSAGTGVMHSEFNHSAREPVHFLQIWIVPKTPGGEPRYAEKRFSEDERRNRWHLLVSGDGRNGSIEIRQDANLYTACIATGQSLAVDLSPGRGGWLHVVRGRVRAFEELLEGGDAMGLLGEDRFELTAEADSEILFFDLG